MLDVNPMILLFGMPRSGTTWLGKIFDSHPDTVYRHEPDSVQWLQVPALIDVDAWAEHAALFQSFGQRLQGTWPVRVNGKLPLFPKSYYSWPKYHAHRLLTLAEKALSDLLGDPPCPDLLGRTWPAQSPLVWKSIESLGRYGAIVRALQPCRGVHIIRHPCGYISSVLRGERQGKFAASFEASEDYDVYRQLLDTEQARSHGLTLDRLKALAPVERLAWRWVIVNQKAIEDTRAMAQSTTVCYEDLCAEPIATAQKLFAFCGLSWDPQSEEFVAQSTSSQGDAYYSVFKNPMEAAQRWQRELAEQDIERVLAITRTSEPGQLFERRH